MFDHTLFQVSDVFVLLLRQAVCQDGAATAATSVHHSAQQYVHQQQPLFTEVDRQVALRL
jgi:hypothetical protein